MCGMLSSIKVHGVVLLLLMMLTGLVMNGGVIVLRCREQEETLVREGAG